MKQKFLKIVLVLITSYLSVKAQNSFSNISNLNEKYYLQFYFQHAKISDHYIRLNAETSELKIYNGKSLPKVTNNQESILVLRSFFNVGKIVSNNELGLHIGSLNYPCRIYCNGKLIYTLGSYKDIHTSKIRFSSSVMLPPDFLKYDTINELSIQIYQSEMKSASLGKLFISSKKVVDKFTFYKNLISVNLVQSTLIISLILAFYFLFLYILKKDKKNFKYLLYALFCIFLSLGYSNITFSFDGINEFIVYKISRTSLPISSLFLLYYTMAATRAFKIKKRFASIFAIPTLVFVILFMSENSLTNIEKILKVFAYTINIPYMLLAFVLVIISYYKTRSKSDFAFAIGFIVLFVAIFADTLNYLSGITPYTWVIPHGFLFFIIVIFFILSTEQTKAFNLSIERGMQLQLLKDNLESKVEERTAQIKSQNEELKTQSEYLKDANFEIQTQKNIIERNHKNVTDSISYAKLIQKAVLPSDEIIQMLLPQHFIIFNPSNIVSGDFYFIRQVRQYTIVCAIDCTGHGIPGALISMLGTALINEIVLNREITSANEVLDELRIQVKNSLQQTGQQGERQEGMDIAFCSINLETMVMSFAGAHNPLWIFRQLTENATIPGSPKFELIELTADHQPVGISFKEKPFGEHCIELKTGDVFYLFTDGYYSQFSYKNGSTFKSRRFKELLTEIHHLPMKEQKEILEQKFNDWKGNTAQTDDVLVIGVRI